MKKDSVNTFNGGLNFDLNPITTPNNILTDCVNGTFITFNGDELALQNEAGNTKILVPGTTDEYVELSTGFYPIGIQEYGGVLYIVSAKKPDITPRIFEGGASHTSGNVYYTTVGSTTPIKFVAGATHTAGLVYYETVGITTTYYDCLTTNTDNTIGSNFSEIGEVLAFATQYKLTVSYYDCTTTNTDATLPVEYNDNFTYIGGLVEFNNKYGEVEFGSYPAPIASGYLESTGLTWTQDNDTGGAGISLYKPQVINNHVFQAGDFIQFTDGWNNITTLSKYNGLGTYTPAFYKVKLWHQLNNGFLDLTDDIWAKYIAYDSSGIHWLHDSDFKYYCPNLYKGKLAMSLEIEGISFEFNGYPLTAYDAGDSTYYLAASINITDTSYIDVTDVEITIQVGDDAAVTTTESVTTGSPYGYELFEIDTRDYGASFEWGNTYADQPLTYTIIPIIAGASTADLPSDFLDQYTLTGTIYLSSSDTVVDLVKDDTTVTCYSPTQSYYQVNRWVLKDGSGNLISNTLYPTEETYVFLEEGTAATAGDRIMGRYTLNFGSPSEAVITTEYMPIALEIRDVFDSEDFIVAATAGTHSECYYIYLYFDVQASIDADYEVAAFFFESPGAGGFTQESPDADITNIIDDETDETYIRWKVSRGNNTLTSEVQGVLPVEINTNSNELINAEYDIGLVSYLTFLRDSISDTRSVDLSISGSSGSQVTLNFDTGNSVITDTTFGTWFAVPSGGITLDDWYDSDGGANLQKFQGTVSTGLQEALDEVTFQVDWNTSTLEPEEFRIVFSDGTIQTFSLTQNGGTSRWEGSASITIYTYDTVWEGAQNINSGSIGISYNYNYGVSITDTMTFVDNSDYTSEYNTAAIKYADIDVIDNVSITSGTTATGTYENIPFGGYVVGDFTDVDGFLFFTENYPATEMYTYEGISVINDPTSALTQTVDF